MYLNPNALPPQFLIDAVPGADDLATKARGAITALTDAQATLRSASDAYRAVATGPLSDPIPRPGVTTAELNAATDTHRAASQAEDQAQRNRNRALGRLHDHIQAGMRDPAFIEAHEQIADKAQDAAVAAMAALRAAITDRDFADKVAGRQRDRSAAPFEVPYVLRQIEDYVNARILTDQARAQNKLADGIMTPDQRAAAARQAGLIR
jgi:hypothetical protein